MEILLFIFLAVIIGIVTFFCGRSTTQKREDRNFEQEKREHQLAIQQLTNNRNYLEDINKNLQQEYDSKKRTIEEANEIAEREYNLKAETLEEKYKTRNEQLEKAFSQYKNNIYSNFEITEKELLQQIADLEQELKQLSNTKAATIEALQREEKLQEEKDNYRVVLSKIEEDDITILHSVRPKLENKRILDMLIWQTFVRDKLKQTMLYVFPEKDMTGIYKITNLTNNKCYIGQARKLQERINTHFKHGLYIDCPQGNKLYEAMQKDGIQNFTVELLEKCKAEELNQKEKYYIGLYNAVDWGYNKTVGVN